jgi:hypothetical protein
MEETRNAAIDGKNPPDIRKLVSALASKDKMERENARATLVIVGEPAITPLLKELRNPDRWVRWEAAKTLAEMREPCAAPVLVGYLTNEHPDLRWMAAEGLIALGNDSLVPLMKALTDFKGSLWLSEGAHHVLHDLSLGRVHEGEYEYEPISPLSSETRSLIKPVLESLNNVGSTTLTPEHAKIALYKLEQLQKKAITD